MLHRIALGIRLALAVTPGWAGPCTSRIAVIEKSVVAKHEGVGSSWSAPLRPAPLSGPPCHDQTRQ